MLLNGVCPRSALKGNWCKLRPQPNFISVSFIICTLLTISALAQSQPGSLRGQVTDPSGAVVTDAVVTATAPGGQTISAKTDHEGNYEIGPLPPGKYAVSARAKGFTTYTQPDVVVTAGQTQFDIPLDIEVEKENIQVQGDSGAEVQVSPSGNASALVLQGEDLEALPDDPDELQQDLQALAGPSEGPNGGQIYIDGFTGGQLPPKSSIREIRINQNPFSAEFDKLGYGRIEIFTKPGTDKFHGQVAVVGNASALNARNPFLAPDQTAPYDSEQYMGNIGGPLSKKASFFFDFQRRNINELAVINTPALDSNLNQTLLSESIPNPRTRTNLSPRFDYQVTPNNTLTARYQYYRDTQQNAGVGQFALPSTGYDTASTEHTLQVSDSQVLGTKAINETRFQYVRDNSQQNPLSTAPTINVIGAFLGGGSDQGAQTDHTDRYELQNYTSLAMGAHFFKFGGRLRIYHDVNTSGEGFNGTFVFPDLTTYQAAAQALAAGATSAPGAIQFNLQASPSGGIPTVPVTVVDAGLYLQDEWKLRPTFTVSYGLRFETQNAIHDHGDWAPRVGFAWAMDGGGKKTAKTVLRAGYGLFYERFTSELLLNAERQNGITQQQYIVSTSNGADVSFFPQVPAVSQLPAETTPTIYSLASNLQAPYIMQAAVSVERQLTKTANVTITYLNSRGLHQLLTRNANAPLPGGPFSSGPRPDPTAGNIYQYDSGGIFKQNQLIANFNVRAGAKLSLFGYYTLNYANSNTSGASSFPSDQYNLALDYGRAVFGVRHRLFFGGTVGMPYGFRLSPFMIVTSGTPYNVTAGQDLSGDSLFNDRPTFAPAPTGICLSPTEACHYAVPFGPYVPIPVNYLTGPSHFTLNLRLSKTFGFGPERGGTGQRSSDAGPGGHGGPGGMGGGGGARGGGGGGSVGFGGGPHGGFDAGSSNRRYGLTFSVNARNVLNHVNLATPIGNLTSPLFGESNALAGGPFSSSASNRRIELQAAFSF
jgi:hypothetical protein